MMPVRLSTLVRQLPCGPLGHAAKTAFVKRGHSWFNTSTRLLTTTAAPLFARYPNGASVFFSLRPSGGAHTRAERYMSSKGKKRGKPANMSTESPVDSNLRLDMDLIKDKMHKTVMVFKKELGTLRVGVAQPSLLDRVKVTVNGTTAPLADVASVSVKDPQTLLVIPSDPALMESIDRAIRNAQLGFNPSIQDTIIKVPVPRPTKEHRDNLLKSAKLLMEQFKSQIRVVRQNAMKDLKKDIAEQSLSKEEQRTLEKRIQALTDDHNKELDAALQTKTKEVTK
ncbi:hypothetical protein H4R35_002897 [Dimargaris xerosporica]|nr:hypothetical protein H4R35_002897 [Dimargaris xerosporica]